MAETAAVETFGTLESAVAVGAGVYRPRKNAAGTSDCFVETYETTAMSRCCCHSPAHSGLQQTAVQVSRTAERFATPLTPANSSRTGMSGIRGKCVTEWCGGSWMACFG